MFTKFVRALVSMSLLSGFLTTCGGDPSWEGVGSERPYICEHYPANHPMMPPECK